MRSLYEQNGIALYDFRASVRRAVVDHNDLYVCIGLRESTFNCLGDEKAAVITRDDYGYQWRGRATDCEHVRPSVWHLVTTKKKMTAPVTHGSFTLTLQDENCIKNRREYLTGTISYLRIA